MSNYDSKYWDEKTWSKNTLKRWFKKFSKEHSWHKCGGDTEFYLRPQNNNNFPWTWHMRHGTSKNIPAEVDKIILTHPTMMNGLVWGGSLHIVLGQGGWPFITQLEKRYPNTIRKLKKYIKDNSAENDLRYKVNYNCDYDIEPKFIKNMMEAEYQRMYDSAKNNYYLTINKIYAWFRTQFKKTDVNMGDLSYLYTMYQTHRKQIVFVVYDDLKLFHLDLVNICIEYHDIF